MPIHLPKGVEVKISDDNTLTVKGPLGELNQKINPMIEMKLEDGVLHFNRPNDEKETKALHGLYRALAANMIKGVSEGFKTVQEVIGVGYKVQATGNVWRWISDTPTKSSSSWLPKSRLRLSPKKVRTPSLP